MNIFEQFNVGGPLFARNDAYFEGKFISKASVMFAYVEKSVTYTITESDFLINATTGTFTITLPTAVGIAGRVYIVKNSGTGTITVDGNSDETIDGVANVSLSTQWDIVRLMSNGANWIKL